MSGSGASGAIVLGAGIGGLTAAIALRRVGIEATVFERAGELRDIQVGGGFHLWANAMRALRDLGLADRTIAAGTPVERTEFRSRGGRLLGVWPVGEVGRKLGVPNIGLSRADLHRGVLAGALPAEALHLGAACTEFVQDDEGVTVRLADGREERGGLLIGADGVNSIVRARLHGQGKPRYVGYTQWQAVIDFPAEPSLDGVERVLFGPGARFVFHRVGGGRMFWTCATYGPATGRDGGQGRKARLAARFKGWQVPVAALIEATDEADITWRDVYDRRPLGRWGEGRVTMLGDAAHPMTTTLAQGACQTIEDAVVLMRCLDGAGDLPAALRAYEAQRAPRTSAISRQSARLTALGSWRNPLACLLRDRLMILTMGGVALRGHEQDMAFAF